MNIAVFIRQTLDTEEKITLREGKINTEGVKFIFNPYDEYAVEEALRLKEKHGGEITVFAVGPDRLENALRHVLAVGADQAVLVNEERLIEDDYVLSKMLASALRLRGSFDILLGGYVSMENGSTQMGPRLAEELGLPYITAVTKLDVEDKHVLAERDAEGDTETVVSSLPILITTQQGLNELRYPSLPGIMKAKKKAIERYSLQDLSLTPREASANIEVVETYLPAKKDRIIWLEGDSVEQTNQLIGLLSGKLKTIEPGR